MKQALNILYFCNSPEGIQRRPWAQEKVESSLQNNFSGQNTSESNL